LPDRDKESSEEWARRHGYDSRTPEEDKEREAQKHRAEQNRRKEVQNKIPETFRLINQAIDTYYCPQCKAIVKHKQKFCHSCGIKLKRKRC
jgi:uncharacterized protein YlaI